LWIFFLGAEIHHHSCIRDGSIFGDIGNFSVSHNQNGIGAFLTRFVSSLCHATKIFSECPLPDIFGSWVVHELFITADHFTGCGMDHGHCNLF
jgi:hypothetical protein